MWKKYHIVVVCACPGEYGNENEKKRGQGWATGEEFVYGPYRALSEFESLPYELNCVPITNHRNYDAFLESVTDGKMESPGVFSRFGIQLVPVEQSDRSDGRLIPESDADRAP